MNEKEPKKELSEEQIDQIVIRKAQDRDAIKKGLDAYYRKTGKSPLNNPEAIQFAKEYSENPDDDKKNISNVNSNAIAFGSPTTNNFNPEQFKEQASKETDPDLITNFDVVKLTSYGKFYPFKEELTVEYLTSKDEDLLTTPALMENGTVLDELLKRKIKTKGINVENMLTGDKNAILIFLRASSYGHMYGVSVNNPQTGKPFKTEVDLRKIGYKQITEFPDQNGEFVVEIPMRNKIVKFRLLNDKELREVINKAELIQQTYNQLFAEISTLRLKTAITEIDGNRSKDYIHRFVDAMPAGDALKIRRKMEDVTPGVDLTYEFIAPDGVTFRAPLAMGLDFFFPSL